MTIVIYAIEGKSSDPEVLVFTFVGDMADDPEIVGSQRPLADVIMSRRPQARFRIWPIGRHLWPPTWRLLGWRP